MRYRICFLDVISTHECGVNSVFLTKIQTYLVAFSVGLVFSGEERAFAHGLPERKKVAVFVTFSIENSFSSPLYFSNGKLSRMEINLLPKT